MRTGDLVVFMGKRYKIIEILEELRGNSFLKEAYGEFVENY